MSPTFTIALKDLKQHVRDRSIFIIAIVAPLLLAFVFNLIFGNAFGDEGFRPDFGVVDLDGGPLAEGFRGALAEIDAEGVITLSTPETVEAARAALDAGDIDAAIVLPAGLSDAISAGRAAAVEVIGHVDAPTSAGIARAMAEGFADEVHTRGLAALTAAMAGVVPVTEVPQLAQTLQPAAPPLAVVTSPLSPRQLSSSTYYSAGLAIFFIFFIAGTAIISMLEERTNGTMPRLLAAPIPRASVAAGKALASVVVAFGALLILVVGTSLMIGADWGDPLGVVILCAAATLAVTSMMTAVGGLAKTAEQGSNLQSVVGVTMAMIGGSFIPIGTSNATLYALSRLTPNAWFLEGLGGVHAEGWTGALPAAGVLLLMALLWSSLAFVVVRRAVRA